MRQLFSILPLLSFAACAPIPDETELSYTVDERGEPSPIPPSIELIVGFLTPGMSTGATVTGVPEDASVYLVRSSNRGEGPCPDILAGQCMEIVAPLHPYGPVDAESGEWAYFPINVPSSVPLGRTVATQAVSISPTEGIALSSSVVNTVEGGWGCTALWDPVCGYDGVTYGNECEALAAGMAVESPGSC